MTEDELVKALTQLIEKHANPEDAFSVAELSQMLGIAESTVRKRLRVALRRGRLEYCRKNTISIDCRTISVPAYRLISEG